MPGFTPLHNALLNAPNGGEEVARYLIGLGAVVNTNRCGGEGAQTNSDCFSETSIMLEV